MATCCRANVREVQRRLAILVGSLEGGQSIVRVRSGSGENRELSEESRPAASAGLAPAALLAHIRRDVVTARSAMGLKRAAAGARLGRRPRLVALRAALLVANLLVGLVQLASLQQHPQHQASETGIRTSAKHTLDPPSCSNTLFQQTQSSTRAEQRAQAEVLPKPLHPTSLVTHRVRLAQVLGAGALVYVAHGAAEPLARRHQPPQQ